MLGGYNKRERVAMAGQPMSVVEFKSKCRDIADRRLWHVDFTDHPDGCEAWFCDPEKRSRPDMAQAYLEDGEAFGLRQIEAVVLSS